ncbi:MAG: NADP-dependent methylenetetrahydromethanopterin/methylenetetrahydrofolate dehydrogenase [Aureliella sp.]
MEPARILVQLDSDPHPSVFDAVVAVDAGIEHLFQYANVNASNVRGLVHGAMFTRSPKELNRTALFVGGSSVSQGEAILSKIRQTFFGPVRCSVMFDGNGSNTTAAAAVLCAARHVDLAAARCVILGGTGPVGQRVARLLLTQNADVCLTSRDLAKADAVCEELRKRIPAESSAKLRPCSVEDQATFGQALESATAVFSCGAAGVRLLDEKQLSAADQLRVAIDLNAVPPPGIEGIGAADKGTERGQRCDYGAIGVGGLKMKIHREAIRALFTRNDLVLDAEEIFEIGQKLQ